MQAAVNGDHLQPSLSRASTDSYTNAETALHASDYIFLDPEWLVTCIKQILSHKLIAEIATYEKLTLK